MTTEAVLQQAQREQESETAAIALLRSFDGVSDASMPKLIRQNEGVC